MPGKVWVHCTQRMLPCREEVGRLTFHTPPNGWGCSASWSPYRGWSKMGWRFKLSTYTKHTLSVGTRGTSSLVSNRMFPCGILSFSIHDLGHWNMYLRLMCWVKTVREDWLPNESFMRENVYKEREACTILKVWVCLPQTLLRHIQTSLTRGGGMAVPDTGFDSRMRPAFPVPGSWPALPCPLPCWQAADSPN